MTCGIYKLGFNGTDLVYIGQSENIESRYGSHIFNMARGRHTNVNVQAPQNVVHTRVGKYLLARWCCNLGNTNLSVD